MLIPIVADRARSDTGRHSLPAGTTPAQETPAPAPLSPSVLFSLSGASQASRSDALERLAAFLSPDQAKALKEQQGKGDALVQQLDQLRQSMVSDRKGNARQKLDMAKAKLQLLRQLGGDPKTIARQAKQIAQEIREAAQEYSSALQSEGGSASPAAAAESGTSGAPADTAAPAAKGEGASPAADASATKPEDAAKAYTDLASKADARFSKDQAEREVGEQFKDAARQVKALLDEAARKLKEQKAKGLEADEAEKAGKDMMREVDRLAASVNEASLGAEGAQGAPVPAPTIDLSV